MADKAVKTGEIAPDAETESSEPQEKSRRPELDDFATSRTRNWKSSSYQPVASRMDDECREQLPTDDEDKGYAGIHSKYWYLASTTAFLLGMIVTITY